MKKSRSMADIKCEMQTIDISALSEVECNEELEKGYDLKQSFSYDRLLFYMFALETLTKNS